MALLKYNEVFKYDEWHEDDGDVLWFHFYDFESSPDTLISSPISSDFGDNGDNYWTHFVIMNFNPVFEKAMADINNQPPK